MAKIIFENEIYESNENESVLDCLIRNGKMITHSCKNGICQSCILKSSSRLSGGSQKGLSQAKKNAGFFLSCQEIAIGDLEVYQPEASIVFMESMIVDQQSLSDSVVKVTIRPSKDFNYRAGQFVNLIRKDGLCRSYSIANKTGDRDLTFHVRRVPNGEMSNWLFDKVLKGESVRITDPLGDCYLSPEMDDRDLLLIGVGTGLAPLYGVIQDCLCLGRTRRVTLFHGGLTEKSLYLVSEIRELARENPFLNYWPVYLNGEGREGFIKGDLVQLVKDFAYDKANTVVMICGDPILVKKLKQEIFLAGVSAKNILSDPFG